MGVYTKAKIHPKRKMPNTPPLEIADDGSSFRAWDAATNDDIAATRDRAAAKQKEPIANLRKKI